MPVRSTKMEIEVKSKIPDEKIKAVNVLVELRIKDYLSIANQIIDKNDMQRKRIKSSKTVYSLLRHDMRQGCTIPPIFLAVRKDAVTANKGTNANVTPSDTAIKSYIETKQLIILDGLQRTYQMLELEAELIKEGDKEALKRFVDRKIRAEIFIGINKIGILYRMLTLNTGQTPMSIRHQIEILYQDYLGQNKIEGVELVREIDTSKKVGLGRYKFNEIVDGFQSYLEKDELAMDKSSILEEVKSLEKLAKVGQKKELFQDFVSCFHAFFQKISNLGKGFRIDDDDDIWDKMPQPFGVDIVSMFLKSQVLTGFGSALGVLEDAENIDDFEGLIPVIKKIQLGGSKDEVFMDLIEKMETIRKTSKKIGNSQRRYFYFFFKSLFNSDLDSYLNISKAIGKAFQSYKVEFL
jgi:hypothetical protein